MGHHFEATQEILNKFAKPCVKIGKRTGDRMTNKL